MPKNWVRIVVKVWFVVLALSHHINISFTRFCFSGNLQLFWAMSFLLWMILVATPMVKIKNVYGQLKTVLLITTDGILNHIPHIFGYFNLSKWQHHTNWYGSGIILRYSCLSIYRKWFLRWTKPEGMPMQYAQVVKSITMLNTSKNNNNNIKTKRINSKKSIFRWCFFSSRHHASKAIRNV